MWLAKQTFNFSLWLEFDAYNNVAHYEELLLGLEALKDTGIKILNIKVYSHLGVSQVKKKISCKSDRLENYRNTI